MTKQGARMQAGTTTGISPCTIVAAGYSLPAVVREMTQACRAFELFSARHLRSFGLTQAQFVVLLALAGQAEMSFKQLSEQTFITKGSLTGIVDRIEEKGLALRVASQKDRRSSFVNLTEEGRATFSRVASNHFAFLHQAFCAFNAEELAGIEASFHRFRQLFNQPSGF
jgi:MarR family transcriptional regulator, 2-MHQ and catechol-resistance regulon repressor